MFHQLRPNIRIRPGPTLTMLATVMLLASCVCGSYGTKFEYEAFYQSKGNCTCEGTTYICTSGTKVEKFPKSYFCDQKELNDTGFCKCDGTTLKCTYEMCWYSSSISMPDNGKEMDSNVYLPCTSDGKNPKTQDTGLPSRTGGTTNLFANSELCKGNPANTATLTKTNTPTSTSVSTNTSTPTGVPTDTPTSTATSTSTPVVKKTEAVTEPPAQCGPGWLPSAGCSCCGSTLVCADGTVAEFNPQCTGGSGGGAACVCGNHICQPECGEAFATCAEDC